jgi:hypothetical protein
LWCNGRGSFGQRLSFHWPLTLLGVLHSSKIWKTSTSFPCDLDKMSHTCSLIGSHYCYSLASWIFFACAFTYIPLKRRLSFANCVLQAKILLVAASSQGAHFESLEGLGSSPSQACSILVLPFSSFSREESK